MPEFQLKFGQIGQNFPAALRAAGTKTSRFPLKETVFAVKNTPNFRGASRRFGRGGFIRTKHLVQILVGGFYSCQKSQEK